MIPYEYERGVKAANKLIASRNKQAILENFGYSCAAPDQTSFDKGYQETIRKWYNDSKRTD